MDLPGSRRIVRPVLAARPATPLDVGCRCCSCDPDTIDQFCRTHGGPTTRSCEDCRSPGVVHMNTDVTPVSVQQKRAGIPDRTHTTGSAP
jgi:hypothetical protein